MIYLDWLRLTLLSFIVDVLGVFVLPVAIYFSDGKSLPYWAWMWGNDREPLGDVDRKASIDAANGFRRGWLRYCWLAWRNPGNNFGYDVGCKQWDDVTYTFTGNPKTSDQGTYGTLFVTSWRDNLVDGFCFYGIWPSWIKGKCRRVFIGWKIHDMKNDGGFAQLVCVYNPFMTFTEKPAQ